MCMINRSGKRTGLRVSLAPVAGFAVGFALCLWGGIAYASMPGAATSTPSKEWYEVGIWPLAGSVAAIVIANVVAVLIVYLNSAASMKVVLRERKIESLSSSLGEFYDPLLSLVDINHEVFQKTGPPSFPAEYIEREAAALVWKETKRRILMNNEQIEKILTTKSHLMRASDSMKNYHALLIHVAMYDTFQRVQSDRYSGFQFPKGIREHLESNRKEVLSDLRKAVGSDRK